MSQKFVPLLEKPVIKCNFTRLPNNLKHKFSRLLPYICATFFSNFRFILIFPPNVHTRVSISRQNCDHFFSSFSVELLHSLNRFLVLVWKMNPLNAKKLTYLRAQAYALRVNGFTVKEITKKLEKSERSGRREAPKILKINNEEIGRAHV